MRIPRIYWPHDLQSGEHTTLDAAATHYLSRVLRLRPPAPVTLFNGEGGQYAATIERMDRDATVVLIEHFDAREAESPLQLTLAQGISRGERMDFTLQKAVEIGVSRIIPLVTEHCGVRLEGTRLAARLAHWRSVASSACEQCGRNRVPFLEDARTLAEWMETIVPPGADGSVLDGPRIVFDPHGGPVREAVPAPPRSAIVLIGPEGGLSATELTAARERGFLAVRLGPRVLRTETAGIAGLAALQALWGDLGN